MSRGSRNLLMLGAACLLFAGITTSISLNIYKDTGDIYLDRSRPGFLPDEEEAAKDAEVSTDFQFSETGPLSKAELEEYLKELETLRGKLHNLKPYQATPLTDESLGIPADDTENN